MSARALTRVEVLSRVKTGTLSCEHNAGFAQAPASAEDFHRRVPSRTTLDRVFQLEEERVSPMIGSGAMTRGTFKWRGRAVTRRRAVQWWCVRRETGRLSSAIGGADAVDRDRRAGEAHAGPGADAALKRPASARPAERRPSVATRVRRAAPPVARRSDDRSITKSLWKLPQPWTPRTRPPLLGNHRTVSTSSHRQPRKGTFLFR